MILVACLLAAACTDAPGATPTGPEDVAPPAPPAVASVAIDPATVSLEEGATRELSLAVTAEDGTPLVRAAAWRVTDAAVAELSGTGAGRVVKGMKAGTTRVIATVDGVADTATVDVSAPVPTVASVELSPSKMSVNEGGTGEVSLTITGSDGSELDLEAEWSVESPSHAELSGKGKTRKVKGRKSGSTRVIAEVDGVVDTTDVEVTKPEPAGQKVGSVRLSSSSISLEEGGATELTLHVTAPNGSSLDREGNWRVDDPSVAALRGNGATRTVEAVGAGSTSVIASVDGIADTTQVSVSAVSEPPPAPGSVSVVESKVRTSSVRYVADWSASESADGYRWSAGSDDGAWSASDTGVTGLKAEFEAPRGESDDASYFCVAAVNEDSASEQRCTGFTVPALEQEGSGGGSGSDPDSGTGSDSTTVGADTTVAKVIVLPDTPSIQAGGTVQLTATAKNASDSTLSATFSWTSAAPSVATVDGSGLVKGQADGTAKIVAKTSGVADTATVTVTSGTSSPPQSSPTGPDQNDHVLLDTRAGGAHSIQQATSIVHVRNIIDGSPDIDAYASEWPDDQDTHKWQWDDNFDGNGTAAMAVVWHAVNGSYGDQGRKISFRLPGNPSDELYVQFKMWQGRTQSSADRGIGAGQVGAFDFTNGSDPVGNAGAKRYRILRTGVGGGAQNSFDLLYPGPAPVRPILANSSGTFGGCNRNKVTQGTSTEAVTSYNPEGHYNQVNTVTIYQRPASSAGATDGVAKVWINGNLILADSTMCGTQAWDRFQLPMVIRSPVMDMTEYFWDFVVWEPK